MARPVSVIELQERAQRYFPRTELVDGLGRSLILPETRELKLVEVRDVGDGVKVMAQGLVGYAPLTETIALNIVPKFPIENLWRMLEIGRESYRRILSTLRRYQSKAEDPPILLLAKTFCHYLRAALGTGLERSYYQRVRTGYYQPHVEFGSTISRHASRGDTVHTVSSVFEFGLDTPVNQIVKAACLRFVRTIPRTSDWKEERHVLQLALDTLRRVNEREPAGSEFDLDRSVSLRVRRHYTGLLRVYRLALTGEGVAFAFGPHGQELPSFLFDLEQIFERFVRQTLAEGLRETGVAVLDGNKHQRRLFADSTVYWTKPDLIFRRSRKNGPIGLGDVKYKPRLVEADRYQIISHVTAANAPVGILFTPTKEDESQGVERIGRLSTGAEFYRYRVSLMGDIKTCQERMIEDVHSML